MEGGIFDSIVEQSDSGLNSTQNLTTQPSETSSHILSVASAQQDDAFQQLQDVLHEQDCLRQELECFQQDIHEQEQHFQEEHQALSEQSAMQIQEALENRDRNHLQSLQAEVDRLQAVHQQKVSEYTQAREEMEHRLRELETIQIQASKMYILL